MAVDELVPQTRAGIALCEECGHDDIARAPLRLRVLMTLRVRPAIPRCHADVSDHLDWLPECPCENRFHRSIR